MRLSRIGAIHYRLAWVHCYVTSHANIMRICVTFFSHGLLLLARDVILVMNLYHTSCSLRLSSQNLTRIGWFWFLSLGKFFS